MSPTSYAAEQNGAGYQQVGSNHTLVAGNDNKVYVGIADHRVNSILEKLNTTNPPDDKHRIEATKGGLLKDCYHWILVHDDFRSWYEGKESKLMWIRGDPGKGKTMLMCGIIDYIKQTTKDTDAMLAFFFCQASDERLNNKTAVLRGLNYMLMKHPQSTPSHDKIIGRYGDAGADVFKGANGWFALHAILKTLLEQSTPHPKYIIIDGLDECIEGREELLDLVACLAGANVRVLVSSRNWAEIEEYLDENSDKYSLQLELNDATVKDAISSFISTKVEALTKRKKLDEPTQEAVSNYLHDNASNTFLWVALVCQELSKPRTRSWSILADIKAFTPGLEAFYEQETRRIEANRDQARVLKYVLGIAALVYRPITLLELLTMVDLPEEHRRELMSNREAAENLWKEKVESCDSFLVVTGNNTIYFIHQSAFEFAKKRFIHLEESGSTGASHGDLAKRAISALSATLHQDMYECKRPATTISNALQQNNGSLDRVAYQCVHWADHATAAVSSQSHPDMLEDDGIVEGFLGRHTLHWLEALSLLGSAPSAINSLTDLIRVAESTSVPLDQREANGIRETSPDCLLLRDTLRFIMHFVDCVRDYPIQIYACAPVFTPAASPLRRRLALQHMRPRWMKALPEPPKNWNECLRTISAEVERLVVSPSGSRMASVGDKGSIVVWDTLTGQKIQQFDIPNHYRDRYTESLRFSPNGDTVAFGLITNLTVHVHVASINTGNIQLLETVGTTCWKWDNAKLSFSPDGRSISLVTQAFGDQKIRLIQWHATKTPAKSLERWASAAKSTCPIKDRPGKVLRFSQCGTFVAIYLQDEKARKDMYIIIWDVVSKHQILHILWNHTNVEGVSFTPDSSRCVLWDELEAHGLHIRNGTTIKLRIDVSEIHPRNFDIECMAWSPFDDFFAVGVVGGICVLKADGSFHRFLRVSLFFAHALYFSKDGFRLFFFN